MKKTEFQSRYGGRLKITAVVTDPEIFHWLHNLILKENRARKIQGSELIAYDIKMSDGCGTTIGPGNQGS